MATLFKYVDGILVELSPEETECRIAEMAAAEAEYNANLYRERRVAEYPPIGDQLDSMWKWLSKQNLDGEAKLMYNTIKEIKEKYPR